MIGDLRVTFLYDWSEADVTRMAGIYPEVYAPMTGARSVGASRYCSRWCVRNWSAAVSVTTMCM
jgi:hypothetical protein